MARDLLFGLLLRLVDSLQDFIAPRYRWLNEFLAATQLLDQTDILDFTLVPLEGAVDRLSFFYFNNQHADYIKF